mgnify:CR=1 FL=1
MALNLLDLPGCPLDQQTFSWRELAPGPISKLDDDAFTRVRVIQMNAIEHESLRFQHACARMNSELRLPLAQIRRVEQHQATTIGNLIGAEHSPLETTIAHEQLAIELTATIAQREPDPYLAGVYRYGLLEDCDHLYRFAAMLDRLEGKDANTILQCHTDILPGRPTVVEHRAPQDELRRPFDRRFVTLDSRFNALTITAVKQRTHDYYLNTGPLFSDPLARLLYAEIASIEEQHVTQYESIADPLQGWLEQWLLHEANEAWLYLGCVAQEPNPRLRALWERFLDYELGQLREVARLFRHIERRDPAEALAAAPPPLQLQSQREFVQRTVAAETGRRAVGARFTDDGTESDSTLDYRERMNDAGSPSDAIASGYRWKPGTELNRLPLHP